MSNLIDAILSGEKPQALANSRGHLAIQFYKSYFFLTYYLGCCPFRIILKKTGTLTQFHIHQWWPQKLYCALTTILCSFWIFWDCRPIIQRNYGKHPAAVFQTVLTTVNSLSKLIIIKRFWMDKEMFLNILNLLLTSPEFEKTTASKQKNP